MTSSRAMQDDDAMPNDDAVPNENQSKRQLQDELHKTKQLRAVEVQKFERVQEELITAKEYAESIVNTVHKPLIILDKELLVQSANAAFYNLFQLQPQHVEGKPFYAIAQGEWDSPKLRMLLEQVFLKGENFSDHQMRQNSATQGQRIILFSAHRLQKLPLLLLTIEDITKRKKATDTLLQSKERYRLLVENAAEYAIFTMDIDGIIVTWNLGSERILGWTEEEAIGQSGEIIFTETDKKNGRFQLEISRAAKNEFANDQRWHRRKDGIQFWANGMMYPLRADPGHEGIGDKHKGSLHGFAKLLRDETERRKTELALQKSEERYRALNETLEEQVESRSQQIRLLVSQLSLVEQSERQRLSQILHDDLQQQLFGIQMKLNLVQADIKDGQIESISKELAAAEEWTLQCIRLTRQLSVDLSPPILENEGLTEALDWLVSQMQKNHNLVVQLVADQSFHMENREKLLLLFRIVRELLFNVVKHAEVSRATIVLEEFELEDKSEDKMGEKGKQETEDSQIVITVSDHGQGFDLSAFSDEKQQKRGLGLRSIQQRLAFFEGSMKIESTVGEGTHITIQIPFIRKFIMH